jgi:hypothetical protein
MSKEIILANQLNFSIISPGWEDALIGMAMEWYEWDVESHFRYGGSAGIPVLEELLDQEGYSEFVDDLASDELYGEPSYYSFYDFENEEEADIFYETSSYYFNFLLNDIAYYFDLNRVFHIKYGEIYHRPVLEVW